MNLAAADFPGFYQAVHGWPCFPWQRDLVAHILDTGAWPDLIDVPTGLGKTSMLDVAVFVAAATATSPGTTRIGRRRTFFVVDRRLVVDEATEHAQRLADALRTAESSEPTGPVHAVATALRSYAPDAGGDLLPVTTMRGGLTWEAAWLDRPDRPGIVLGTVDQVGSRLLFRGYGVSERRRSIDAAFVGTDALLLVDEAHLATALTTTVDAAGERDVLGLPLPGLDVVRLSATGKAPRRPYVLDTESHRADDEAWRRLTAAKELFRAQSDTKAIVTDLAGIAAELLREHDGGPAAARVLVVCNTVDRARAVHDALTRASVRDGTGWECDLLIGRSRPLDRQGLNRQVLDRYGTGHEAEEGPGAILVATQTVEVGVNLDVDALVTESAPWDALVQRLGRLNRLGSYTSRFAARTAATAVVVHDGRAEGPVYGAARDETWQELSRHAPAWPRESAGLGVSPLQCRDLTTQAGFEGTDPPAPPILLTPTLDAWARTAPAPLPDPPIEAFLHGFDTGLPGVSIAWRDGLIVRGAVVDPFDDEGPEVGAAVAGQLLTALPIRAGEQIEVPFVAVRQWLAGQTASPVGDVELTPDAEPRSRQVGEPFRALALRGGGHGTGTEAPLRWRWIGSEELRPGDSIVVPAERGGLDGYGWNPGSIVPVMDVGDLATFVGGARGRRAVLRLDDGLPDRLGLTGEPAGSLLRALHDLAGTPGEVASAQDPVATIAGLIRTVVEEPPSPALPPVTRALRDALQDGWWDEPLEIVDVLDSRDGVLDSGPPRPLLRLLVGPVPRPRPGSDAGDGVIRDDDEPAASSAARRTVALATHLDRVRARAEQIARALGLPADLVAAVGDAARWHDLGKQDERFQAMLHGGDPHAALIAVEPLAKSGMDADDRLARLRARHRSGLPPGARHEAWSAGLVAAAMSDRDGPGGDTDLVIHLVASHHGHSRPWLPLVTDPDPRPVTAEIDGRVVSVSSAATVQLDGPGRFARLNTRYGRWGLALLETVVRCADMTVSGEGS